MSPPLLAEVILSGPEVATTERALAAVVEKSGLSADELAVATDLADLDLLASRVWPGGCSMCVWLDSSSCGLFGRRSRPARRGTCPSPTYRSW